MRQEAIRYLMHHKVFVFLCALGIAISIGCILTVEYLSSSLQKELMNEMDELGSNIITLQIEHPEYEEGDLIRRWKENGLVTYITPMKMSQEMVKEDIVTIYEVNDEYEKMNRLTFQEGRFFTSQEKDKAVLGYSLSEKLNRHIGDTILYQGNQYEVIGILEEGSSDLFQEYDVSIFLPYQAASSNMYRLICPSAHSFDALEQYCKTTFGSDGYQLESNQELNGMMEDVMGMISDVLQVIAMISLVVAIFGLFGMSYITGKERTHEWGIRKAIGATRWNMIQQLSMESLLLSLFGFFLGAGFSLVMCYSFSSLLELSFSFDWGSFIRLGMVTTFVGAIAGSIPAIVSSFKPVSESFP